MANELEKNDKPRYAWPWFVLAAVMLGAVLAAVWMSAAVNRVREQREGGGMIYSAPTTVAANVVPTNNLPAEFRDALAGGDAAAGRKVFFESPAASCSKCHKAGGQGGDIGPALDGEGARQSRERILEAVLFPNRHTTTNFECVILLLKSNSGISGILKSEDATSIVVNTTDEGLVTVKKSDVQLRQKGLSPMPEGLGQVLPRKDLRDLLEYVASLPALK